MKGNTVGPRILEGVVRMRRLLEVLVCVALISLAPPASAANVTNFHHPATVVELDASTCSIDVAVYEVECSDTFVSFGRVSAHDRFGLRTPPTHKNPWFVFVYDAHYILHRGPSPEEPEFELLYERVGFLEGASGSMDTARLLSADVSAEVPMDDGSMLALDLQWDFSGTELHVSGNDGPIQEEGAPWGSHISDPCFTANWHAHQTWRWGGSITGELDGVDASTLFHFNEGPFIGRGVFTVIETEYGGCI
jgi:hypothetical protein